MIFHTTPGRVSHLAQTSIQEAVLHAARTAKHESNCDIRWGSTGTLAYLDVAQKFGAD